MSNPEASSNPEQVPKEIERKFKIAELPQNLEEFRHATIRQGYLAIDSDGAEARLRDKDGKYTLTVKSGGTLQRNEWEEIIPEALFETF